MKKISKMITLLLTLAMVFALAACGNGDGGNGGEQANDNPYNLDYKSTEVQPMSDERATKETLAETQKDYFQDLNVFTGSDLEKLTYKDVVEHIGVDPSAYMYEASYGRQIYFWFVDDSTGPWLSVYFNEDGTLYASGSVNLN